MGEGGRGVERVVWVFVCLFVLALQLFFFYSFLNFSCVFLFLFSFAGLLSPVSVFA